MKWALLSIDYYFSFREIATNDIMENFGKKGATI